MILTELTTVPDTALPLQNLKDQLRLGTGFGQDTLQDSLLTSMLKAAVTAIEGRTDKALIQRQFSLRIEDWKSLDEQPLPLAPVVSIDAVATVQSDGTQVPLDPTYYRLVPDTHRPRLAATGVLFPNVPGDGYITINLTAGFAATWDGVPDDIAQAVLILAATYYENRHEAGGRTSGLPHAVTALIEHWRTVRVLGGGTA